MLIAIYESEADSRTLWQRIYSSTGRYISAATYTEAGIVALRRDSRAGLEIVRSIVEELAIDICDVTAEQAKIAQEAYLRYGKGFNPVGLNFGDCFVYALARARREPVLCKGPEFGKTDIAVVG